jgi:hypothetical protein
MKVAKRWDIFDFLSLFRKIQNEFIRNLYLENYYVSLIFYKN